MFILYTSSQLFQNPHRYWLCERHFVQNVRDMWRRLFIRVFSYIYRCMRQSMTPEALQPCKFVTKVVTKWAKNARFLGWFWVWRVFYCVAVRFCVRIWAKNAPYLWHKMPAGCWCGIFVYKNWLNCGQKMPEIWHKATPRNYVYYCWKICNIFNIKNIFKNLKKILTVPNMCVNIISERRKQKEREDKTMKRIPEWILDEMESKNKQADEYDYVSYEEARAKSM